MNKSISLFVLLLILAGCTAVGAPEGMLRDYKNGDPKICETMGFSCPEGQTYFSDKTGCGCEWQEETTE